MSTRLERSVSNRMIGGVCGGIAEYLQVDATLVRVVFVIAAVFTAGAFFLAYVALLVLMPLPGGAAPFVQAPPPASGEPGEATTPATTARIAPSADPEAAERRRATIGYFLVALGIVFLLGNLGAFRIVRWDIVWPLVLVGLGALLLAQRFRRS